MASRQDKKLRRIVNKKMRADIDEMVRGLQIMITRLPFRHRLSIAMNVIWGKAFLTDSKKEADTLTPPQRKRESAQ